MGAFVLTPNGRKLKAIERNGPFYNEGGQQTSVKQFRLRWKIPTSRSSRSSRDPSPCPPKSKSVACASPRICGSKRVSFALSARRTNPPKRFDSARLPVWRSGRRKGLKSCCAVRSILSNRWPDGDDHQGFQCRRHDNLEPGRTWRYLYGSDLHRIGRRQ
jgi:hypothetical protein